MDKIIVNKIFRDDEKHKKMETEDMKGEEAISGSNPDLESDDDVAEMEHKAGLYLEEDEEHPKESGLAEEIEKAEEDL